MHLLPDVKRFPEWVAVVAFYKAVQIVEAVFEHKHGRCCHGHEKRLDALKSRGYRALHKHYRALWAASSIARYLYDTTTQTQHSFASFANYLSPAHAENKLVYQRLRGIECEAISLLSTGAAAQLQRLPERN